MLFCFVLWIWNINLSTLPLAFRYNCSVSFYHHSVNYLSAFIDLFSLILIFFIFSVICLQMTMIGLLMRLYIYQSKFIHIGPTLFRFSSFPLCPGYNNCQSDCGISLFLLIQWFFRAAISLVGCIMGYWEQLEIWSPLKKQASSLGCVTYLLYD